MKHLIEIVGIVPILWVSMDMGISHVLYILYRFSTLHQRLDLMFLILIVILSSAVLFLITWSLSNGVDTNLTYLSVGSLPNYISKHFSSKTLHRLIYYCLLKPVTFLRAISYSVRSYQRKSRATLSLYLQ